MSEKIGHQDQSGEEVTITLTKEEVDTLRRVLHNHLYDLKEYTPDEYIHKVIDLHNKVSDKVIMTFSFVKKYITI